MQLHLTVLAAYARVHQYTLQAVADTLGLHYATVSKIAKRVDSACHSPC